MAQSSKYFDQFPTIVYGTKVARDIIARPNVVNKIFNSPFAFFDYVVEHDQRPDQVAYNYYNDADLAWLVLLTNKILDPYTQWPMNQEEFYDYLKNKYGSLAAAQSTILHYKHVTKDIIITNETYNLNATFESIAAADYAPVYAFSYEVDLNDVKRNIRLLDRRHVPQVKEELRAIMRQ